MQRTETDNAVQLQESAELAIAAVAQAWNEVCHRATFSEPALRGTSLERLVITFDGASPFHQGGRFTEATAGPLTLSQDSPLLYALSLALQGVFAWSVFLADAREAVARNGRVQLGVETGQARILDLGAADRVDPNEVNIRELAYYVVDIVEDAWEYARREMTYCPRPDLVSSDIDNIVLRLSAVGWSIASVTADGVLLTGELLPLGALVESLEDPHWQEFRRQSWWAVNGNGLVELRINPPRARILSGR